MESLRENFGRGPRELTGAVDLISHFKLLTHHDYFCKRPVPSSLSDAHYLQNVVGDTDIRKGEGMQLDQLIQNTSYTRDSHVQIKPFPLDVLHEAFQLQETGPVELPPEEKGIPTIACKRSTASKDKERKHRKHRDKDKEKDREHKKHKHRHKDRSKDKEKDKKERSGKHQEKKRKHEGDDNLTDVQRPKKSKHRSSKLEEMSAIKVAG